MSHRSQSSYRNSDLARSKGKKGGFLGFFNQTFKRHRSEVGLVEDSHNSTTIIRIIVGLLLVHLIIIGGVILHGKIDAGNSAVADSALTPPPAETATPTAPQPVPGPVANPGHITQPLPATPVVTTPTQPIAAADTEVDAEPVEAVEPTATTNPADTAHKMAVLGTGETLTRFAAKHNTTVQAILAINPEITNPNVIAAGTNIRVPLPADSEEAKRIAADREAARMEREGVPYKVRSGDNLGKISNRFGTSVTAIQKLNNMTGTNIRVNQVIQIPATAKAREYAKDPEAFFRKPSTPRRNNRRR